MPLSIADFDAICMLVCPHCRSGHRAVVRPDTGEWVHNQTFNREAGGQTFSHGLCWADGLRRSAYAPVDQVEVGGGSVQDHAG